MHQNSIIYRTYGGIGIGQKFAAECGIKHKFVAEWRNGRPRKTPPQKMNLKTLSYLVVRVAKGLEKE